MTLPPAPAAVPAGFREAILQVCPELRSVPLSVEGRGWHSIAIDAGGRTIFKFPEGAEAEAALRQEARLLAHARPALTMPVPAMTIHPGPPLFSEHPKLPGAILLRDGYDALGDAARGRLAADIALFFAELHALAVPAMRAAGAAAIPLWATDDGTLAPVWPLLPPAVARRARHGIAAYRRLGPDPLGERYGFFDLHGWNMAFDAAGQRLRGIFDFADSGIGPIHREFVPVSLVAPDLARRAMAAYAARTGRAIEPSRVFLLAAAMRLSELAGAVEAGLGFEPALRMAVEWFEQWDVPPAA